LGEFTEILVSVICERGTSVSPRSGGAVNESLEPMAHRLELLQSFIHVEKLKPSNVSLPTREAIVRWTSQFQKLISTSVLNEKAAFQIM